MTLQPIRSAERHRFGGPEALHDCTIHAVGCAYLRRRGIKATIPVPADPVRNQQSLGSRRGRPPKFDKADYRERHAVECGINRLKRHRSVATTLPAETMRR